MKILFIGDIVAKPGRKTIEKILPEIKEEYSPDFVIANAENLSHGNGFSPDHIGKMQKAGIDFFTSGDHTWGNKKGVIELDNPDFPVIRPANYASDKVPGKGYKIIEVSSANKILVINLLGRVFIRRDYECPFHYVDKILKENADEKFAAIIVDLHAEASSEKYAMSFYLDGRVTAVLGTHTHVPTADYRILENGTATMTDVGMTGPYDSVIGVKKDIIIESFLSQMPGKFEPENNGPMVFNAALIEIDKNTAKALTIQHIQKVI